MLSNTRQSTSGNTAFYKEVLADGVPKKVRCVEIDSRIFTVTGSFPRVMSLENEWDDKIGDPERLIEWVKANKSIAVDILAFWQEFPDGEPKFALSHEWREIAVVSFESFDDWWRNRITTKVRTQIRKAERSGVTVDETCFDDAFVKGMTKIFNESPVRQGRRFWHYGKDEATVKRQFSRFIGQERVAGAYIDGEMIGFIMVANMGRVACMGQILSTIADREKRINEALVSKAIEIAASQGNRHLVYAFWGDSSLMEFKRKFGFRSVRVPRYLVPLTLRGSLALKLRAHLGVGAWVPPGIKNQLKRLRAAANARVFG